jgi:hypothetical protein
LSARWATKQAALGTLDRRRPLHDFHAPYDALINAMKGNLGENKASSQSVGSLTTDGPALSDGQSPSVDTA